MSKKQITQLLAISIGIVVVLIVWAVFFYNPSSTSNNSVNTTNPTDNSKIVRKIGNHPLTENRVQIEIDNLHRYGYQPAEDATPDEIDSFNKRMKEQAISNLTDFYLVLVYAEENNFETITDEQINERISQILTQSDMTLSSYLSLGGVTEGEFQEQVTGQLIFERVLTPLSAEVPEPTDKELEDHFNQNRQAYVVPETVEYQQMVVGDMATCRKAIGLLNSGKSFADVVNDFSQNDAVRESGGLMPVMSKEDIPISMIANALFPPFEGYENTAVINKPMYIETESSGIFIINLLYRNPSQSPELNGFIEMYDSTKGVANKLPIKDKVYSDWKSKKEMELSNKFITDLRDKYKSSIIDY